MSQLPRAQLNQSLQVPGLAVTPPVSAGVTQATEILRSIQQFGNTAANIGNVAGHIADKREDEQAAIDAAVRGQAAADIRAQMPELKAKIARGELDGLFTDLQEGETIHGRVEAYISERMGEDVPEPYRESFMRYAPDITASLVARQQSMIDAAKADSASLAINGVATATSTGDLKMAATAYQDITGETAMSSKQQVILGATKMLGEMDAADPKTEAYLNNLERYAPNDANVIIARQRFIKDRQRAEDSMRVDQAREFRGAVQEQIRSGNFDAAALDRKAKSLKFLDPETYNVSMRLLKDAETGHYEQALADLSDNMDRQGTPPDVARVKLNNFAQQNGIPLDRAADLINNRVMAQANTLAMRAETQEDVNAVMDMRKRLMRTTDNDNNDFTAIEERAKRAYEQNLSAMRAQALKEAKVQQRNEIMANYIGYFEDGVPLDQLKPTDDITIDVMGEDVTYKVGPMFDEIHNLVVAKGDVDALAGLPKDATNAQKGDAIFNSRIRMIDRTGMADPDFKKLFATSRITSIPIGTNPEDVPETVLRAGELFDQLDRMNLATIHMADQVYAKYKAATTMVRLGLAPSFADAVSMTANPPRRNTPELRRNSVEFNDKVDEFIDDMGITKYDANTRDGLLETANTLIQYGADPEVAVDTAIDVFKNGNIIIDGFPFQYNGVGASASDIAGMWDGLKDFVSEKRPKLIENNEDGKDSLVMYRNPFNGQVVIHADDALGGSGLVLTDEQFSALANDYGKYRTNVIEFANDVEAINRAQQRKDGAVTLGELGEGIMTSISGILRGKTDSQITDQINNQFYGEGASPTTRPPLKPIETKDPLLIEISQYLRKREEQAYNKEQTDKAGAVKQPLTITGPMAPFGMN